MLRLSPPRLLALELAATRRSLAPTWSGGLGTRHSLFVSATRRGFSPAAEQLITAERVPGGLQLANGQRIKGGGCLKRDRQFARRDWLTEQVASRTLN
jgi:hypothetical protein